MHVRHLAPLLAAGALYSLASVATAAPTTTRVSAATNGTQGNSSSGVSVSSISANGRYIVFQSYATNLVDGETQGSNCYVRDTVTGTTTLVSVGMNGASSNGFSSEPSISADGRYVVFSSDADNLVANDTNQIQDIFIRDLKTNTTTLVSVGALGWLDDEGDIYGRSDDAVVSGDGRYVVFESDSAGLCTEPVTNIFVRDTQAGTTTLVSVAFEGGQGNLDSNGPVVSADGRYVAFDSEATNLVPDDTNQIQDIFIRDLKASTTTLVSVGAFGAPDEYGDIHARSSGPSLSGDGRYVAFESNASGILPGVSGEVRNVFVRDTQNQATAQVSLAKNGGQPNDSSGDPAFSRDGRYIAFESNATNLVDEAVTGFGDVFVRDLKTGTNTLASVGQDGSVIHAYSNNPSISADGRYVAFQCDGDTVVPGDTNLERDVFLRGPLYSVDPGVTAAAGGAVKSSPTAVDGVAYFGDDTGKLHAISTADGAAVSGFPIDLAAGFGAPMKIASRPAVYYTAAGKGIYFLTDLGVVGRVNADGTGFEGYSSGLMGVGNVGSPAVLPDGTVFVGLSFDTASGIVKFDPTWRGTAQALLAAQGATVSSVAVAGNKVYVGLTGGTAGDILVLNAADLTPLSSGVANGEGVTAPPYVVGQDMYVGTLAGNFYKLNSSNSSVDTTFGTGGKVAVGESLPTSAFYHSGAFYAGSTKGKVWKIGLDGTLSKTYDTWNPSAVVGGVVVERASNTLAFGTSAGDFYKVPLNGGDAGIFGPSLGFETTPTYDSSTGRFFIGSNDGNVYGF